MPATSKARPTSVGRSGKNANSRRSPGQLTEAIRIEQRHRISRSIRTWVENVEGRTWSGAYQQCLDVLLDQVAVTAQAGWEVSAPSLAAATRRSVRTAERFLRDVRNCPDLQSTQGRRHPDPARARRERLALSPDYADQAYSYSRVERGVRLARGLRGVAYRTVLGVPPPTSAWGPVATRCRRRGESPRYAGDSRERRQSEASVPTPKPQAVPSQKSSKVTPHGTNKQPRKRGASVRAVPSAFEGVYKDLLAALEELAPGKVLPESLKKILSESPVAPEEAVQLVRTAPKLATPKTKSLVGHILSALQGTPGGRALADSCRALMRQEEAQKRASEEIVVEKPRATQASPLEAAEKAMAAELQAVSPTINLQGALKVARKVIQRELVQNWSEFKAVLKAAEAKARRREESGLAKGFDAVFLHIIQSNDLDVIAAKDKAAGLPQAPRRSWADDFSIVHQSPDLVAAIADWRKHQASAPSPDSPGFLDHFDENRRRFRKVVKLAEAGLGDECEVLRKKLRQRLVEANLQEGTLVWQRAWDHNWSQIVCEAKEIPMEGAK